MAGRPGLYDKWITPDGLTTIEGWAREGLNDEELAAKMGIKKTALYEWKRRFPDFAEAIKKGKAPVDFHVENALLKLALGHKETIREPIKVKTKKQVKDKTIEEEHIEYAEREIYIPPNVTAQMFWLRNRKPAKWRDKPISDAGDVEDLTPLADMLAGGKNE